MDTTTPPTTTPLFIPAYDQIVKGNVTIKKISKHNYRITFSKIGKFLVYQVWDKDNAGNLNSHRSVFYLSAKKWINHFNDMNKNLKQKKEPLFTPTTVIEMEDQDDNYAFVIHKAYLNTCGHVVFTVSTKEITSSKKLIKIPRGKFNNVRFDIDASRNGYGFVYHRSDCSYPGHRMYGAGGDWPGSVCGYWQDALTVYAAKCGYPFTRADIVWYGVYDSYDETYVNLKNKIGGGGHNWTDIEVTNFTYRGICL